MTFSRALIGLSGIILAAGGLMHGRAFPKVITAVSESNIQGFYGNSLKALWLIDSATLLTLALVFALLAAKPQLGSKVLIVLLALIPGATAFFLYKYIGSFIPAHMLMVASLSAVLAGVGWNTVDIKS